MPLYTVERQYLAPVFVHITLEAETAEAAAREAMDENAYGWDAAKVDHEGARSHYITGIWAGETAYVGDCLPPPADCTDPDVPLPCLNELRAAVRAHVDEFGGDVPDWLQESVGRLETALAACETRPAPAAKAAPIGNATFQDVGMVLGWAESFVQHWETDEGQDAEEQAEADEARAVLDRTAPVIREAFALITGADGGMPLVDVLGDGAGALTGLDEQLDQLVRFTRPTFDDDSGIENAVEAGTEAEDHLSRMAKRFEALGAQPYEAPIVVIDVTGGIVQDFFASAPVEAIVIDNDTDGADDDELYMIPGRGAETDFEACLFRHAPVIDPAWTRAVHEDSFLTDPQARAEAGEDELSVDGEGDE